LSYKVPERSEWERGAVPLVYLLPRHLWRGRKRVRNPDNIIRYWIIGSSPIMTMKRKQLQALLEAVFPGLSFPT
jgi:hypothetical protein